MGRPSILGSAFLLSLTFPLALFCLERQSLFSSYLWFSVSSLPYSALVILWVGSVETFSQARCRALGSSLTSLVSCEAFLPFGSISQFGCWDGIFLLLVFVLARSLSLLVSQQPVSPWLPVTIHQVYLLADIVSPLLCSGTFLMDSSFFHGLCLGSCYAKSLFCCAVCWWVCVCPLCGVLYPF